MEKEENEDDSVDDSDEIEAQMQTSQEDHNMSEKESKQKSNIDGNLKFKIVGGDSSDEERKEPEQVKGQMPTKMIFGKEVAADDMMELESLDIASSVAPSKK